MSQVVEKFADMHTAVLTELKRAGSWGNHQVVVKVEMLTASAVHMSLKCSRCGSWMESRHAAHMGIDLVRAATMMVESFTGFHEDDCEEARRVNIVRDVMES